MKSIIFKQAGLLTEVLELAEVNIKEPANDEVQIKIIARPINPSDEMFIQGMYRQKPSFPQIAGLEGAGIIEKCGQTIDKYLIGKHVAFRAKGTWAEKINLKTTDFTVIPDTISFEVACQLSLNTLTAFALLESAGLSKNEWLLLTAANSSVCQQIIQIAKQKNINVIAIVRNDDQIDKLKALGAKLVINNTKLDLVKEIHDHVKDGVNVSLDAVGGSIGSMLFKVAASFSKIIIYGRISNEPVSFLNGDVVYKNLQLKGFGIDAWIKSKTKEEMNDIWNSIFLSLSNKSLNISYDNLFDLLEFETAIKLHKKNGGRTILK
jgi:NADPH2:quinone reductase